MSTTSEWDGRILLVGKRKIAFVAICGISPGGRFFQTIYGVASRLCRSPSIAFPQERRSTLSHCVAKPLAQLNGWGRTWIIGESRIPGISSGNRKPRCGLAESINQPPNYANFSDLTRKPRCGLAESINQPPHYVQCTGVMSSRI